MRISCFQKLPVLAVGLLVCALGCSRESSYRRHLDDGIHALREARHAEAAKAFGEAMLIHRDSATAYCNLGVALQGLDKPNEAIEAFMMASDLVSSDARPLLLLGNAFVDAGKTAEARAILAELVDSYPNSAEVLTHVARLEYRMEDYEAALRALQSALDADSHYAPALYNMAIYRRDRDEDADGALRYFARYLACNPSEEGRVERAKTQIARLRSPVPEARVTVESTRDVQHKAAPPPVVVPAAKPKPEPTPDVRAADTPISRIDQARKAIEDHAYDRALVLLNQAATRSPTDPEPLWELGQLYMGPLGDNARAARALRRFAAVFSSDPRAATAQRQAERLEQARVQSEVDRKEARGAWAEAARAQKNGDTAAAIRNYTRAITLDDRYRGIGSYNLGLLYKADGELANARQWFARATEADDSLAKAHYMLAATAWELGDSAAAIAACKRAIAKQSGYFKAYYLLGILYEDTMQLDEAERALRQAVTTAPDDNAEQTARKRLDVVAALRGER